MATTTVECPRGGLVEILESGICTANNKECDGCEYYKTEAEENDLCAKHSAKFGIDGLNVDTDCENLPCRKGCPWSDPDEEEDEDL